MLCCFVYTIEAVKQSQCLPKISLKYFPKHPARLVWKKGAFGPIRSVLGITTLYSRKSLEISVQVSFRAQKLKLVKNLAAMTFVKSLCSKS